MVTPAADGTVRISVADSILADGPSVREVRVTVDNDATSGSGVTISNLNGEACYESEYSYEFVPPIFFAKYGKAAQDEGFCSVCNAACLNFVFFSQFCSISFKIYFWGLWG